MRTPKKLIYATLEGLSEKQLKEHHDVLYAGYVKKIDEIEEKLKKVDLATANATYSDLRELKVEETFALNGVKLHEGYFDNRHEGVGSLPAPLKLLSSAILVSMTSGLPSLRRWVLRRADGLFLGMISTRSVLKISFAIRIIREAFGI